MPTNIFIQNNLSVSLTVSTSVSPALDSKYWGVSSNGAGKGLKTKILFMNRNTGIKNGKTWFFTTSFTFAGVQILLQEQLTGTFANSNIRIQIVAGRQNTGWSANNIALTFTGTDGSVNRLTGTYVGAGTYNDVIYDITQESQGGILPQIEHVVVLMNENRSMDNLLGFLYESGSKPTQFIPPGSQQSFDGLKANGISNSDSAVNNGRPVYASSGTTSWTVGGKTSPPWNVPTPDPGEEFEEVTEQIFNGKPTADMSGFLTNYVKFVNDEGGPANSAAQIMQSYSPNQVPVMSFLAKSFATSDAWYASVPTQTWPNRGFLLTGSSNGDANNNNYLPWDITTIFDVLQSENIDWKVYNEGTLQSLVKTMFLTKYFGNKTNFKGIDDFAVACSQPTGAPAGVKIPPFSFLEPNFGVVGIDESYHPPHDIRPGEQFLKKIYGIIKDSPYRDKILFVVLFDEHGGTYDHVVPPSGAHPPYPFPVATDGTGFTFSRYGVRTPAIVVSSYTKPGTVFRTSTETPLDHTSILATLRDWLGLQTSFASMLKSPRIMAAPNIADVLTEDSPQGWPSIPSLTLAEEASIAAIPEPPDDELLSDLHRALLVAAAGIATGRPFTDAEAIAAHEQLRTFRDARAWMMALQPSLPLK